MKIRTAIIIGVVLILVGGVFKLVYDTKTAIDDLKTKLIAAQELLGDGDTFYKYDSLQRVLKEDPNQADLSSDLDQVFITYGEIFIELVEIDNFLDDSLSVPQRANKGQQFAAEQAKNNYWRGDDPAANDGAGNGRAHDLSFMLNAWLLDIQMINTEHKIMTPENEIYIPEQYGIWDEAGKWEREIFDAPLSANYAMLERLKMDAKEVMTLEIQYAFAKLAQSPN